MKKIRSDLKSVVTIVAYFVLGMVFAGCDKPEILLNDKQITAFSFDMPSAIGMINEAERTITVDIPLGTDISTLTPVINVSPKATVTPASGVMQNFTEPVIYTVMAEDGSTTQYTATINMKNTNEVVTKDFYVFSIDRDEQCGYLLFEDRGSPFDYHNFFVWAENLPQDYQEHLLPVTVTFYYTEEKCSSYPIINIIKIQKQ